MARVVGVDLPRNKRVEASLLAIYGVGATRARQICEKSDVNPDTRVRDLTDAEVSKLTATVQEYAVEGDLRREVAANVKRLMDINCYRGLRHKRNLPVHGQRTRTNARTRKGRRGATIRRK